MPGDVVFDHIGNRLGSLQGLLLGNGVTAFAYLPPLFARLLPGISKLQLRVAPKLEPCPILAARLRVDEEEGFSASGRRPQAKPFDGQVKEVCLLLVPIDLGGLAETISEFDGWHAFLRESGLCDLRNDLRRNGRLVETQRDFKGPR